MILYDYFRSSAAYRVRIALNLKGVTYQAVEVHLVEGAQRSPEHLARNPQGFVPALALDDGTILTQSLAIIEWLDATYPEPRLIPAEPLARARAMAQALTIAADIHPLNNLRVLKRLKQSGIADDARDDWYRHWVAEGFAALEQMAGADAANGPYLGGDTPGIADVLLVPQMYNARRFDLPLDAYPRLVAADAAARALEPFAAASPERVKPQ
ncbi:maleylacetoacetate isomerase [Sphingomonas turrisvirgatae]|uniref:Maleylacetoacetate isomerase n=1 Tax=Sphingomonas turrisvirgatae TaxID=1888892 RepID=A0A1E3LQM2_9SPHN|nr:maleylacetoacetate isomerase [Sphingomonas turrisvirgatae]ODP36048.1 maleylacetoacetate isomerase [Sphingomonas turrisvirgatae]